MKKAGFLYKFTLNFITAPRPRLWFFPAGCPPLRPSPARGGRIIKINKQGEGELNNLKNAPKSRKSPKAQSAGVFILNIRGIILL